MTPPRHLPMTPNRAFARLMELTNRTAYLATLSVTDVPKSGAMLEIGFGSGMFLQLARRKWPDISLAGVDPTPEMVAMARHRRALRRDERTDLREGTAANLPWPANSFDAVVAIHSFQFWSSPEACLAEVARVLRPGSQLVLTLRDHERDAPDWLPNPLSRSGREIQAAVDLLRATGFDAPQVKTLANRAILLARRPQ